VLLGGIDMFYDLVKTRRSIRQFEDKEIEKDKVDRILKSGLMAPTSKNGRSWEFIAVTNKEQLQKLSDSRENGVRQLATAKLAIVVAADPEVIDVWVEDVSIAAITMQFTAHSLGIGSCWIQIRKRLGTDHGESQEVVKNALNIPEKYQVGCMLVFGYPAEEKQPHDESKLLYDKVHYNKF
jgi:nitroreductase